jgi:hypothetical protein
MVLRLGELIPRALSIWLGKFAMQIDRRLAELLDKEEIRELLCVYCHAIDRMDVAMIESVFHPDAKLDYGYFKGGRTDLVAFSNKALARYAGTHHSLSNIIVRINNDEASSVSYVTALHYKNGVGGRQNDMVGYARYVDHLERRSGIWKIVHRTVVFDWTLVFPSSFEWPESLLGNVGRRDKRDPTYSVIPAL